MTHRIFTTAFSDVYPLYLAKVEKKGRTKAELDHVIEWLTGFSADELDVHVRERSTFEEFFAASRITDKAHLITGVVCGVKVQEVADPLMQKIRYLDKVVDELAKGKSVAKVTRSD